jgi:hypothetical protein
LPASASGYGAPHDASEQHHERSSSAVAGRWPWTLPVQWWELESEELADEIVRRNRSAKPLAALLDARIALGQVTAALPRIDAADWDDAQYIQHPP